MFFNYELTHCPYCGMKLLYIESLSIKNKGLFKCPQCKKKSKVVLNEWVYKLLGFTQVISLIIFTLVVFLGCGYCLLGLIFIALIFGLFYAGLPFMMTLKPQINNSEIIVHHEKITDSTGEDAEKEIYSN